LAVSLGYSGYAAFLAFGQKILADSSSDSSQAGNEDIARSPSRNPGMEALLQENSRLRRELHEARAQEARLKKLLERAGFKNPKPEAFEGMDAFEESSSGMW
jgi:hypothetical protein